ncbi:unnamed protein product [Fusarium graminearum]|nr:unnamed protein product [Fusarium graminearum]VTO90766.1 unnamed protein product [Fusarium graminearum]
MKTEGAPVNMSVNAV